MAEEHPARRAGAPAAPAPQPDGLAASLRDGGRGLLALLVVALLVKLVVVLAAAGGNPLAHQLTSDRLYYLTRAQGLLGVLTDPLASEPYHLPPLYPWLLSLVPGIGQGETLFVHLLQALLGTATLGLVFAFARARCSQRGALVATTLTAAYGPISFFETKLLGDSLAFDLLVALLVVADGFARRPRVPAAALLGGLIAAVALLRPQALLVVPVLAPWVAWRGGGKIAWRPVLAYLGTAALLLVPSVAHNARTSGGDLIVVSDNGGVNLWLANHRQAPLSGTFATHDVRFGDIAKQSDVATGLASAAAGRRLSPGAVSRWYVNEAVGEILADPVRFIRRVGLRGAALAESFGTGIVSIPEVERRMIPPLVVLALPFGVLLGLAVAAGILGARCRAGPASLPALAIGGMVVLTALLFFHYERFRLPLVPLLATLVGAGVDRWRTDVGSRRRVAALGIGSVVALLTFLPQPHHAVTLANGWTSIGTAWLAASAAAMESGQADRAAALAEQALADAERALEAEAGFVRAELLGARAALSLGQLARCDAFLTSVERKAPGLGAALVLRAWLFAASPDGAPTWSRSGARSLYDRLITFPPDDPGATDATAALGDRLGR